MKLYFLFYVLTVFICIIQVFGASSGPETTKKLETNIRKAFETSLHFDKVESDLLQAKWETNLASPETFALKLAASVKAACDATETALKNLQSTMQNPSDWSTDEIDICCKTPHSKDDTCFVPVNEKQNSEDIVPTKFTRQAATNAMQHRIIKRQMFLDLEGRFAQYPTPPFYTECEQDYRQEEWYSKAILRTPQDVVILIDLSDNSIQDSVFKVLGFVMSSLHHTDRISVIGISDKAKTVTGCNTLVYATHTNKEYLLAVAKMVFSFGGKVKLSKAFFSAFYYFDANNLRKKRIMLILANKPDEDWKNIFNIIKEKNSAHQNAVSISTFGFDNYSGAHQFLQDIAKQDGSKYGATTASNATMGVSAIWTYNGYTGDLFMKQTSQISEKISWTGPNSAPGTLERFLTASLPVQLNAKLTGVVAVDVSVMEIIPNLPLPDHLYHTFLVGTSGRVLYHPLIRFWKDTDYPDVSVMGKSQEYMSKFLPRLRELFGEARISDSFSVNITSDWTTEKDNGAVEILPNIQVVFSCSRAGDHPYVACIAVKTGSNQLALPILSDVALNPTTTDFNYHRMDLQTTGSEELCLHLGRTSNKSAAVKFTPAAFVEPVRYYTTKETPSIISQYQAQVAGKANSVSLLTDSAVNFVRLTNRLTAWNGFAENKFYNTWRYFGSYDGVFRIFPAVQLFKGYDHTIQAWYKPAITNKGRIIVTPVYKDFGSSMMVFTMAKAVVLPGVGPVGVLGGDFLSNNIKVFFNGTNCNSDVQCEIVDFYGNVVTSDAGENVANIFTKYPVLSMKLTTAGVATSEWCSNIWTSSNKQNPRLNITLLGNGMTLGSYYVQHINGTNLILVQIYGEVAEETCVVHAIPELMCSPTTTCQSSCTQYSPTCMTSMNTPTNHHGCYQTYINNYKFPLLTSDNHKHPVCYEKFANWNDFVDDDDIDDKDIFSFIHIIGPVMQYGGQAVFAVGLVAWVVYRMKKRSTAQTSPNQFNPDGTIPPPPPPLGDQGNYPGMPPPPPPMGNYPGMPPPSPMGDQGNYPNMSPPPMANQGNYYQPPLQQNYGFQQNFAQQQNMGQPEWQTQYSTPLQPQPPQYPPPPY